MGATPPGGPDTQGIKTPFTLWSTRNRWVVLGLAVLAVIGLGFNPPALFKFPIAGIIIAGAIINIAVGIRRERKARSVPPPAVAVTIKNGTRWVSPQNGSRLHTSEDPPKRRRDGDASPSIAHSVDGLVVALLVGRILRVFTCSQFGHGIVKYERLATTVLEEDAWFGVCRLVAVGRRGSDGVFCAVSFGGDGQGLARFWLDCGGSGLHEHVWYRPSPEVDEYYAPFKGGVFLGSDLIFGAGTDGSARLWPRSQGLPIPNGELSVQLHGERFDKWGPARDGPDAIKWVDGAVVGGATRVVTLEESRSGVHSLAVYDRTGVAGGNLSCPDGSWQEIVVPRTFGGADPTIVLRRQRKVHSVDWKLQVGNG